MTHNSGLYDVKVAHTSVNEYGISLSLLMTTLNQKPGGPGILAFSWCPPLLVILPACSILCASALAQTLTGNQGNCPGGTTYFMMLKVPVLPAYPLQDHFGQYNFVSNV